MEDLDKDFLTIVGKTIDTSRKRNKNRKIKTIVHLLINNNIELRDLEIEYKKQTKQIAKYRHPTTGETWAGTGRKPLWVKRWLESGGSLDAIKEK